MSWLSHLSLSGALESPGLFLSYPSLPLSYNITNILIITHLSSNPKSTQVHLRPRGHSRRPIPTTPAVPRHGGPGALQGRGVLPRRHGRHPPRPRELPGPSVGHGGVQRLQSLLQRGSGHLRLEGGSWRREHRQLN